MKKVLSLILALMLVTGLCATAKVAYVPINAGGSGSVNTANAYMLHAQQSQYSSACDGKTISQRITAQKFIGAVVLRLPSYENDIGKVTVRVYKWNKTLANTLTGKAIGQRNFVDTRDNELFAVPLSETCQDILIHVSDGTDRMGVWTPAVPPAGEVTQTTYIDGAETDRCMLSGVIWGVEKKPEEEKESTGEIRDAYEFIEPGTRDEIAGFTEQKNTDHYDGDGEETFYGMFNISDINKDTTYALFKNVDFGTTSPEGLLFRVYQQHATNYMEIQFVADSLDGEIISSARWFYDHNANGRAKWVEIVSGIAKPITGVHDVYMVSRFGEGKAVIGKFKFLKEKPELTGFEKEVEDFKPVPDSDLINTYSDTWVATDMLGRKLPEHSTAGDRRDKDIGLFYWTWHAQQGYLGTSISNNQNVVDNYVGDINEIKNTMNYPGWMNPGAWNESVYGHYTEFDTWVLRKQLELLSSAGVDFIATDCSNNARVFATGHMYMMREMHKMRQLGYNVPKITFILPWSANAYTTTDLEQLYTGFYASGLYSDCWYYYDGKPLIMGYPGGDLMKSTGNTKVDALHQEISEFFTFRGTQPKYKAGQTAPQQWAWMEVAPQHGFMKKEDGSYELVTVSVAQNSNDKVESYTAMNGEGVYGRSYSYKDKHTKLSDTSLFYGYNFQEQWDNALKIDPEIIFITGWNEWIAGHFESGGGTDVKAAYVDTWIDEYSRDAEPTKGQLKDVYYMQMVANIRKFKGTNPTPVAENSKTVDVNGDFTQWDDIKPEFIGFKGGTEERKGEGFGGNKYTNDTGRNDIVLSKVSQDGEKLYFYVETAENLTPSTDKNWMRLYINTDRKYATGWEGYDFVVNRVSPVDGQAVVEKYAGKDNNFKYAEAVKVPYKVEGNRLMLEIPKSVLGITGVTDIEFKWHDNGVDDGNVLDFYTNGDCAPVGRFNYRYVEEAAVNKVSADEPIDIFNNLDILTRKYVVMGLDKPVAYAKGNRTMIDPANEAIVPMIVNDKTLVPIRFISEALGATVTWNPKTASATINLSGTRIIIKEGSDTLRLEKETKKLQTPAQTFNDRMYVPLRDVSEAFGLDCFWADPGLIVIGNGANIVMNINYDLADRLMERLEIK